MDFNKNWEVFKALDLLFHSRATGILYLFSFRSYKGMNNISAFASCEKKVEMKVAHYQVEFCLYFPSFIIHNAPYSSHLIPA